jgi:hypothetical protein
MVGRDLGTDVDQVFGRHPELGQLALRRHICGREVAAHRPADPLCPRHAGAQLNSGIAVPIGRALGHHLAAVERQNGDRHLPPVFHKQPGHAQLSCDYARAHDDAPLRP